MSDCSSISKSLFKKLEINELTYPPTRNKIDVKFFCPLCEQILLNVHQDDDCGCRYCLECLQKL